MEQLFPFLNQGKSPYHVVENMTRKLQEKGCIQLEEKEDWQLQAGQSYFVTRGGTSCIAFTIPNNKIKGFRMIAAHSDSPTFKIKPNPEMAVNHQYCKLNIEPYGGSIYSSWLDRPLSVAGRVVLEVDGSLVTRTVDIDKDLLVIPNLAIHMNRQCNKGVELNPQVDLLPLMGMFEKEVKVLDLIGTICNVEESQILDYDLFLYPRQQALIWGANEEFIMSPRLDDLECVFGIQESFISTLEESKSSPFSNMLVVFDNEEVGSSTKQGANSTFLEDVIGRITAQLHISEEEKGKMLAESFLISADNGHALHPNYVDKTDPTNKPYLNGGIVIKYHGGQKYITDGYSGAFIKQMCNRAKVPYQTFVNRADMQGGSTLGNILSAHISVAGADIGLAQLAMHSAVEVAGKKDVGYMLKLFELYYGGK